MSWITILKFIWANYSDLIKLYSSIRKVIPAVMDVIKENKPLIDKIVNEGSTPTEAKTAVLKKVLTPHKLTFEEEQSWMNRSGSPG